MHVVDRRGRELTEGHGVERALGGRTGGIRGVVTFVGKQVDVTWATSPPAWRTYSTERLSLFGTGRRCYALELIDPTEDH